MNSNVRFQSPHIRALLISVSLLFGSFVASAGVIEGDFFGYRLGAKYPIGKTTKGYMDVMGGVVLIAEKPEMPSDFERVELIVTPKTFTIANIFAVAEYADEAKAKSLASRYADLLETLHGSKCPPQIAYLGESLKRLCGSIYELTVSHFKPSSSKERHKVYVGLKFENSTEAGKRVLAQFESEIKQLEAEGKRQRLERAIKEQKMKGLQ